MTWNYFFYNQKQNYYVDKIIETEELYKDGRISEQEFISKVDRYGKKISKLQRRAKIKAAVAYTLVVATIVIILI